MGNALFRKVRFAQSVIAEDSLLDIKMARLKRRHCEIRWSRITLHAPPLGCGNFATISFGMLDDKRRIAVKELKPEASSNAYNKFAFLREATILSRLSHPNIVKQRAKYIFENDS